LLSNVSSPLRHSDHEVGHGRAFFEQAGAMPLEGIVCKRADAPYAPGNRGLWVARIAGCSAGPAHVCII
jgi:bifunctional non-homologous end joining protein LigD